VGRKRWTKAGTCRFELSARLSPQTEPLRLHEVRALSLRYFTLHGLHSFPYMNLIVHMSRFKVRKDFNFIGWTSNPINVRPTLSV
jgi:hypothetical protein